MALVTASFGEALVGCCMEAFDRICPGRLVRLLLLDHRRLHHIVGQSRSKLAHSRDHLAAGANEDVAYRVLTAVQNGLSHRFGGVNRWRILRFYGQIVLRVLLIGRVDGRRFYECHTHRRLLGLELHSQSVCEPFYGMLRGAIHTLNRDRAI